MYHSEYTVIVFFGGKGWTSRQRKLLLKKRRFSIADGKEGKDCMATEPVQPVGKSARHSVCLQTGAGMMYGELLGITFCKPFRYKVTNTLDDSPFWHHLMPELVAGGSKA